jgi:hypothetical protein
MLFSSVICREADLLGLAEKLNNEALAERESAIYRRLSSWIKGLTVR